MNFQHRNMNYIYAFIIYIISFKYVLFYHKFGVIILILEISSGLFNNAFLNLLIFTSYLLFIEQGFILHTLANNSPPSP